MTKIISKCKLYAIEITENDNKFIVDVMLCDGQSYGSNSFWFHIGNYSSFERAKKAAIKKMLVHNINF